jgi:hypothetical protein
MFFPTSLRVFRKRQTEFYKRLLQELNQALLSYTTVVLFKIFKLLKFNIYYIFLIDSVNIKNSSLYIRKISSKWLL